MIPSMDSGTRGMLRSFSGSILELFWSYKVDVEKIQVILKNYGVLFWNYDVALEKH